MWDLHVMKHVFTTVLLFASALSLTANYGSMTTTDMDTRRLRLRNSR